MPNTEKYANAASSYLTANVLAGDTLLAVASGTPFSSTGNFRVIIGPPNGTNNEIVLCTARSGNALTVVRGQESTTAQAWPSSTQVTEALTAGGLVQLMGDHTDTTITADPHTIYLKKATVTAKGDIYVGTGSATVVNVPVGSNGQVLTADSTQVPGLKWAASAVTSALTTFGDLVQSIANGVSSRLGIGSAGQILTAVQNAALITTPGSAPTVALIAGSSTLANTQLYSVVFAWRNNFNGSPTVNGLTAASPQASVTTSGSASTQAIQVTCPAAPSGAGVGQTADALLVYLGTSTSGPWYLASTTTSPSMSASNIVTLTAPPNTGNAQPNATNTTGGVSAAWANNAAITDPTTTRGDLIVRGASALARLAVGANQTMLTSNGTDPSWSGSPTLSGTITAQKLVATLTGTAGTYLGQTNGAPASGAHTFGDWATDPTNSKIWICTSAGTNTPGTFGSIGVGFANPMTTSQDLIVGASAGSPVRFPVGSSGQVLGISGGLLTWTAGMTNPMTNNQDIIVAGVAGAPGRLGVGANGQVLSITSGNVGWANSPSGFSNPMTASGDMIMGGTSGVAQRLPVGANGQVLTVAAGGPSWQNATGGGGSSGPGGTLYLAQNCI